MIVTCPACSARYNVKESKIQGRGAKITCPRCAHRFVVYREGEEGGDQVPADIASLDFEEVGITWRVRKAGGKPTHEFHHLGTLREYQQEGQISKYDQISWDGREWTAIDSIPSLDSFFHDVWRRAKAGEIQGSEASAEGSEEDDSDAPTTIVGAGSSLAGEIRQAVADSGTPTPIPPRPEEGAAEAPASPAPAEAPAPPEPPPAPAPVPDPAIAPPQMISPSPASPRDGAPAGAAAPAGPPKPASPPLSAPTDSGSQMGPAVVVLLVLGLLLAAGLYFGGVLGGSADPAPPPGSSAPARGGG